MRLIVLGAGGDGKAVVNIAKQMKSMMKFIFQMIIQKIYRFYENVMNLKI